MANVLRLQEAFKLKMKLFFDLANLLRLWEAFKLKMTSFYGLASSLRLQEAFKVKSEVDLRVIERITFIRSF